MSSRERSSMICKGHEQLKKKLSSNAVTSMVTVTELKHPRLYKEPVILHLLVSKSSSKTRRVC